MRNIKNEKIKEKKVLFLDILTSDKKIKKSFEKEVLLDRIYAEHFAQMAGLKEDEFVFVDATKGKLPDPRKFRMVVIGGSIENSMIGMEKKWMFHVFLWIKKVVRHKIPILGICGGLQFTVRALGGTVIKNPNGREFGTLPMKITSHGKKDFFFRGVSNEFLASESHSYIAKDLKPEWKLLAYSKKTPCEALAIGDRIRLTQFHPEIDLKTITRLFHFRKDVVTGDLFIKKRDISKFIKSFKETAPVGKKIITNFIKKFSK